MDIDSGDSIKILDLNNEEFKLNLKELGSTEFVLVGGGLGYNFLFNREKLIIINSEQEKFIELGYDKIVSLTTTQVKSEENPVIEILTVKAINLYCRKVNNSVVLVQIPIKTFIEGFKIQLTFNAFKQFSNQEVQND